MDRGRAVNILLMTNHLNVGGITTYLFALSRQYRNRGHQVVLVSAGGVREEEFVKLGVVHVRAPLRVKSEVHPATIAAVPRLLKLIRDSKIDVIHSHTRVTQVLGRVLSALSGVPYVSTCHGFYKTRVFRKIFPCWGRAVAAISPAVKDHLLADFHVKPQDVFLIGNGIDIESFACVDDQRRRQARERFAITRSPVIGIVARLADTKGHDVLLKAMPMILEKFPDALLFIAGEGKMKAKLQQLTAELGIEDHVRFANVFNPSGEILSLFDVFAMPSTDEGFGLSGMEAQAAGLPVVASNVGGIPSFVLHEQTGLLVPPHDPAALARAILRFLTDQAEAQTIGRQAREFIEQKFSSEIMAQNTLGMYEHVMASA